MAKVKTSAPPPGLPINLQLAGLALVAVLAIPHLGHAQGLIGGAERGSREGGRAAGPVGAVVGGAVGAGVGAVNGVLVIPYGHHYRCRGYYDRHHRFRCYR